MKRVDSTDLDFPLDLESKIPHENIFQTSKFVREEKTMPPPPTTLYTKNEVLELPSVTSITQKTIATNPYCPPLHLSSLKKREKITEYGVNISGQLSQDKSILFNEDEVSSKQDMIKKDLKSPCKSRHSTLNKKKTHHIKINVLTTVKNVTMAVKKLKSNTIFKSPRYITDKQIDIMNDYAFCKDNTVKSKDEIRLLLAQTKASRIYYRMKIYLKNSFLFQKACELKSNIIKHVPIIEPDNKWKIIWDFCILFLYLCMFFVMGLQISFDLLIIEQIFPENALKQKVFQVALNSLFFLDIIMKSFTAYYQNGILVRVPQKIIKNYLFSHFVYDFLAIIPIFLESYRIFVNEPEIEISNSFFLLIRFSQFLIYFKFFEFVKALDILDDMLQLEEKSEALFNLVKLIFEILLFSHFIACAWHAVANYSPYDHTILEVEHLMHKKWFSRYLTFLFWTISWEKLEPQNDLEFGFGFFAVLASHAVFGFIIEGIHSIIESLGEKNADMKKDIRIINKFMDNKNIGYDLQMKIRKYFYFMHEHKVANSHLENEVIGKLSTSLKEEVLIKAYGEILQSVPLFSQNFSPATIQKLILSMKKLRFYPEEIIFKQGDFLDNSLYLINDGEIDLFLENEEGITNKRLSSIRNLKKGEFFGENSFLTGCQRLSSAVSRSFSTVYAIERKDFLKILSEKPPDFEKYCEMRDKMLNYSNFEDLKKKCEACLKRDHDMFNCPEIHYIPRREFIILRKNYTEPTLDRNLFKRKSAKTHNALKIMNSLQDRNLFVDSIEGPENNIEDNSNDELFNEADLNEVQDPDSPSVIPTLKRIESQLETPPILKIITEEKLPKLREEEREKSVNFDEEALLKETSKTKKKENNTATGQPASKNQIFKFPSSKLVDVTATTAVDKPQSLIHLRSWDQDFEHFRIFTQYFTGNNADVVLKQYEQKMIRKAARISKLKQIKRKKSNSPKKGQLISGFLQRSNEELTSKSKIREKEEASQEKGVEGSPEIVSWRLFEKKQETGKN